MRFVLLFFLVLPLFAKPLITVSIAPQSFFVKQIAGDSVDINELILPNMDEHNLDFKPSIIKKLEKSDIYFTIGLEFENLIIDKFKSNFNLNIIATSKNKIHEHEHHHDHSHDPHIWLDPILVKDQINIIAKALIKQYPNNTKIYETNLIKFQKYIDDLDKEIKTILKNKKNTKFVVYHPSWDYFAKRYNLEQISIEVDGKEPKINDLKKLIMLIKKENINTIFIQPGFSQNAIKALAKENNIKLITLDHLARQWDKELLKIAKHI